MSADKDQIVDEKTMKTMSVAPPDPDKSTEEKAEDREQKELEEGLEETFPASDPPANTQPGHDQPMPSSGYKEKKTD